MTKTDKLYKIEGKLTNLLLELGRTDAQHIRGDKDERCKKLLRMALEELRELDDGGAAMSLDPPSQLTPSQEDACAALQRRMGVGDGGAALSLEASAGSETLDRIANLMAHKMGARVPREDRFGG